MNDERDNKPEEDISGGEDLPPTSPEETPEPSAPKGTPEESVPVEDLGLGSASEFEGEVTEDDKLWVLLTYIFTPLVPIILLLLEDKKDRPFIKAHNGQALVLGVINVILSVTISPFLCGLPSLAILAVSIYWGIQAYQGKEVTIPIVTDFVKNQGWA